MPVKKEKKPFARLRSYGVDIDNPRTLARIQNGIEKFLGRPNRYTKTQIKIIK